LYYLFFSEFLAKNIKISLKFLASFKSEVTTFSNLFKSYLTTYIQAISRCTPQMLKQNITLSALDIFPLVNVDMYDIALKIDDDYYFSLLQRLVYNILYCY
jgi:hypothetical protein